jgi:hypothetical protein
MELKIVSMTIGLAHAVEAISHGAVLGTIFGLHH